MNIKSILVVILITISTQSFSQEMVAMFKDKAIWGFVNLKGEVIIKPRYSFCRNFYNGMAKVGPTSFINIKGEKLKMNVGIVGAREFSDELLAVKVSDNWGYMNTSGELVIPAKYKEVTDFDNGYALVSDKNGSYVIDKQGNLQNINTNSGKITYLKKFSENIAAVEVNGKWGFIDVKGVFVIEPKFVSVGYFSNNVVWVRVDDNKIGYIDNKGKWLIEPTFFGAGSFDTKSGVARVKSKNGWEYINIKGELLPIQDKHIDVFNEFEDGVALVRANSKWGFINPDGSWLLEPKFSEGITSFENGFARLKVDGKWGVINKKGEWVLQPTYDNIKSFYKID